MAGTGARPYNPVLKYRFLQLLVLATFILLLAGGLVTSTDSGLAVPDWPLSYGTLLPPMVGGIRFEHTHRLIALTVGFLTLVLTLWIGKTEKRTSVRWLAIASLGAVVLQGIFGGMTVLYKLPAPVSIVHACIGPIFFSLVVALAVVTNPNFGGRSGVSTSSKGEATSPLQTAMVIMVIVVILQILLGAIVRHTEKAVWIHAVWAFVVLVAAGFAVSKNWSRTTLFLGFLVMMEFFLGIGTFLFTQMKGIPRGMGQVIFPTLHQTLGAVILATAVVLTIPSIIFLFKDRDSPSGAIRSKTNGGTAIRGRPCDAKVAA